MTTTPNEPEVAALCKHKYILLPPLEARLKTVLIMGHVLKETANTVWWMLQKKSWAEFAVWNFHQPAAALEAAWGNPAAKPQRSSLNSRSSTEWLPAPNFSKHPVICSVALSRLVRLHAWSGATGFSLPVRAWVCAYMQKQNVSVGWPSHGGLFSPWAALSSQLSSEQSQLSKVKNTTGRKRFYFTQLRTTWSHWEGR